PSPTRFPYTTLFRSVAEQHDGFGLTEPFIDRQARRRVPGGDDFGIERFAGADAVTQGRELPLGEILANHQAQRGWGSAPRRNRIDRKSTRLNSSHDQ